MDRDQSTNNTFSGHFWTCCTCNNVVTISNHQVSFLAFGIHHCLFLTSSKKVYSFGKNEHGQLGTGDTDDHLKEPYCVTNLPPNVKTICCGPSVSAVISDDGRLYMWGDNSSGQCGLDGDDDIRTPFLVPIFEDSPCEHVLKMRKKAKVVQISCGSTHTMALTASNEIWVWGNGIQLGIPGRIKSLPVRLNFLSGREVLSISCGFNYSLAVVTLTTSQKKTEVMGSETCLSCADASRNICPLGVSMEAVPIEENYICSQTVQPEHEAPAIASPNKTASYTNAVNSSFTFDSNISVPVVDSNALESNFPATAVSQRNQTEEEEDSFIENQIPGSPLDSTIASAKELINSPVFEGTASKSSAEENLTSQSEVELRKALCMPLKRTGSILDPEIAKQYLEKLTDDVFQSKRQDSSVDDSSSQATDSIQKSDSSKLPFVWGVVNKVRNSLDKIQMGSFGITNSSGQIEKSSSQESFEVLETNLLDTEVGSLKDSNENFGKPLVRTGSLKSLLELKQGHKPKENQPSSVEALVTIGRNRDKRRGIDLISKISKDPKSVEKKNSILQTEVWSWGTSEFGQLGHGDELERPTPCCVKQLSGQGVIRVLAGRGHSVALTADGRVISWGLNSHGQLGHSFNQDVVVTPKTVNLPSKELIWDVALGDTRTIFLVDNKAPRVAMYYCGSHEILDGSSCLCPKEKGIHQLNILKKSGLVERVFGGGTFNGCLVNVQGLSELPVLHEFAATERWFLYQLQVLLSKLLSPLLKSTIPSLQDSISDVLKRIIVKLSTLVDMVAVNAYDLTYAVLTKGHLDGVHFAVNFEEWIEVLLSYSNLICDAICVNACSVLSKEWSWTPNKLKMLARDVLGETGIDHKSSSDIVFQMLSLPIRRVKDYVRLLNKVLLSNLRCVQGVSIDGLASMSQQLSDTISSDIKIAEKTKLFWETAPQKLIESYRIPTRRLIRESKTHQLHLQSSGRFSSNVFLLFNDVLVHQHFSSSESYPLQIVWVEPLPDTESVSNAFFLRMPEDVFTLVSTTSAEKTEWICAFNSSIRHILDSGNGKDPLFRWRSQSGGNIFGNDARRLSPPLPRQGTYTFLKTPFFKDAVYTGMWLCGKVHGHGTMTWPDRRKYVGKFKQNVFQGEGVLTVPHGEREFFYEGFWKDNHLNGHGTIKYPSGDYYEGYFKDGQRSGHGMLKQGQLIMSAASVYIGQWLNDQRHGYGVLDNIPMGEKYMGMWHDDCRHGKGLVVTIDGIYYEGTFVNDKLQGFGVMMFEDGTFFEGELGPNGTLDGKGILYLSNGDHIDGSFSGIWSTNIGIKTSGFYHKSTSISSANDIKIAEEKRKWTYGQLCVPASAKWVDIFTMCKENLAMREIDHVQDNCKAWESIAIAVGQHKKGISIKRRQHFSMENFEVLERIPKISNFKGSLSIDEFWEIEQYLSIAADCPFHPIGQLIENIVNVYRAAYLGIGAHQTVLPHAVSEVHMFTSKTYDIIRVLFPDLPADGELFTIPINSELYSEESSQDFQEAIEEEVISPSSLLHPILLPRLYPPLFTLYALHNEKEDEQYWKRIMKWNRQADISLMSFLGVNQKFWMMKVTPQLLEDKLKSLSSFKDVYFATAIDMLQRISTEFTPRDKLKTIHQAFKEINEEVKQGLNEDEFLWNMDDLFPVFQYVVVRARIRHLGSEIHLIGDLMEKHYEMGELGIMFTTLKACYFQIRTEKAQQ